MLADIHKAVKGCDSYRADKSHKAVFKLKKLHGKAESKAETNERKISESEKSHRPVANNVRNDGSGNKNNNIEQSSRKIFACLFLGYQIKKRYDTDDGDNEGYKEHIKQLLL